MADDEHRDLGSPEPPPLPPLDRSLSPRPDLVGEKSGLAEAAFISGLVSVIVPFVASLAAIVLGLIARSRIARNGGRSPDTWKATAGIGTATLLCWLIATVVVQEILDHRGRNPTCFS